MDEKDRKELRKRIILLIFAGILLVLCLVFYSLGWFTFDRDTTAGNLVMNTADEFKIIPVGTSPSTEDTAKVLSDYFKENGYDESTAASLTWTLCNESHVNNLSGNQLEGILPGSYGKLQFEVQVLTGEQIKLHFDLGMIPVDVNDDNGSTEPDDNSDSGSIPLEVAAPFLNTHIYLFSAKEDSYYSDRITENGLDRTFKKSDNGKPENIVTIYWIWPEAMNQILLRPGDENLSDAGTLFSDDETGYMQRKNVIDDILASFDDDSTRQYFLKTADSDKTKTDFITLTDNILAGNEYSEDDYFDLWKKYNKADEALGKGVRYFVLQLTAEPAITSNGS